jgi:LDH2 family malate/lactate/ureidoglycolate dehydrogenase
VTVSTTTGAPPETVKIPAERIRRQIAAILSAWGMKPNLVEITAEVMVDTDLSGIDSHGMSMLVLYEEKQLAGILNPKAEPRIVRENAVTALIDADAGLGHPAAVMAARLAIEKARVSSLAAVSVTNSHHFGAAGYYARLAAEQGFVSLVASNARTVCVVPLGSSLPIFGTNPLALAVPAGNKPPFVLDMATSTVPANKVRVYEYHHKSLPDGWVVDENGRPVNDSSKAMEYIYKRIEGGLTPIGGTPAGSGLSMAVQLLGATLAGASFPGMDERRGKAVGPDRIGHFFLVIDPKAFRPDGGFEADVEEMIDFLHATPPVDAARPVLVAGEPEQRSRERRKIEGVPVPPALIEKIRGICQRAGAQFLLA